MISSEEFGGEIITGVFGTKSQHGKQYMRYYSVGRAECCTAGLSDGCMIIFLFPPFSPFWILLLLPPFQEKNVAPAGWSQGSKCIPVLEQ